MNFSKPIFQAGAILLLSLIVSLGSNFVAGTPLPLIAKELEQATDEDINSNEPVLLVISIDRLRLLARLARLSLYPRQLPALIPSQLMVEVYQQQN